MSVELQVNNSLEARARYVSWAPSPCRLRLTTSVAKAQTITVSNRAATGGQLVFRTSPTSPPKATLKLKLPLAGTSVRFWVSGKFGRPSLADGDAGIRIRSSTKVLAEIPLMVRIRKNANTLTAAERDRFVAAFAKLNDKGLGRFADFRGMHTDLSSPQAHGAPGFLPWHRAYLLDLERELQAIDPSVALPYWRFDRPAPNLFTREFLGASNVTGTVQFAASNPLQFWKTDGVQGVNRRPFFDTATESGINLLDEADTLALGSRYADFQELEGNPHGLAHTSFGGSISSIGTAARDPLFFLLHCNVDRLWAKWQRRFARFDAGSTAAFDRGGAGGNRVGHNLDDSMWPWNGIVNANGRPPTAPGGDLATSPCASAPGPQPRVRDLLDFQGDIAATGRLGFDYDDVRYS